MAGSGEIWPRGDSGKGVLSGLKVLDFSHQFSGPFATMILGDAGADIIKVESPGRGDGIRYEGKLSPEIGSPFFWGSNRNKRSITLNLKDERGLAMALELATQADVVVENFRPGVMDRLGLGYEAIRRVRPEIIYLSVSAFGQTGPMADRPGMDLILQATSGMMGITGESDDRSPVKLGPPVIDITTALYGAIALLLAIRHRDQTGEGQHVELSMLDCSMTLMAPMMTALLSTGAREGRYGSGHPNLAPYQAYRDSEGAYFIVACLTNRFWLKLCARLGMEELGKDERFIDMRQRTRNRDALNAILEPVFARRTADEWIAELSIDDIPCARINKPSEALRLPQVAHNGMVRELDHPVAGRHKVIGSPIGMVPEMALDRHAPMLGEHTAEVLASLGHMRDEIAALREAGVI